MSHGRIYWFRHTLRINQVVFTFSSHRNKNLRPGWLIKILNLLFYPAFASIQNDLSSMDV